MVPTRKNIIYYCHLSNIFIRGHQFTPTRREITGLMGFGWRDGDAWNHELSEASQQESEALFLVSSNPEKGAETRMYLPTSNLESGAFIYFKDF